ncbi:MAG: hypothetical protein JST68_16745 [Bacteroidetes bacterium]|nr:hypothetical protein [Bacteroidota bacterium]
MPKGWTIRWKAFLMLVTFTVNFCVICHCAASAAPVKVGHTHHSCCEKAVCDEKGDGSKAAADCGDKGMKEPKGGCQGMQAVKFNLLEKQASDPVVMGEMPVLWVPTYTYSLPVVELKEPGLRVPEQWAYRHSPPDLRVLHQSFLI